MILAALLDMDGLMIDSDKVISRSYETVLREHGKTPVLNSYGVVHTPGLNATDNWRNLAKVYGIDTGIEELADRKNRLHAEYLKRGVNAMPGLLNLLSMFSEHRIKMAIASSSKRDLVDQVTRHLKISQYFNAIVAGGEVSNGKPAPDIFLEAATKLGVNPLECVVLEDAIDGVRAAKAAKMTCIAVPSRANLNNTDFQIADIVLPSLEQVSWDVIKNLSSP